MEIIKGGWANVPTNLKCRSDLKAMGLVPKNKNNYVALVWNSYDWIQLYDIQDCRPKRKPTTKQLEALQKGREILKQMLTCSKCGEYVHFKQNIYEDLCKWCHEKNKWEAEQEYLRQEHEARLKEGENYFRKWFYEEDFYILDSETTGLHHTAEIIEIAIINKKGETVFEQLIKPLYGISDEVIGIHGITNEMVLEAPEWHEIWPFLYELIKDKKILIFNAEFDVNMIFQSCHAWDMNTSNIELNTECVMEAYRLFCGSERWISLANAVGHWIDHRAKSDCQAVLDLLKKIWKELNLIQEENNYVSNENR